MNKIFIYNSELETRKQEDMDIKIYGLDTDSLISGKWLLSNKFPTYKLLSLYKNIRKINPMKWGDNIKFWDVGSLGCGIFNHVCDEWTQIIE